MPPVSTGLILLKIFGRRSPFGQWLYERGIEIVFNWKGVLIAMSVMSFPLLVRSVRTSFAEVNPRLEQIAATLGASPLRIFFVITMPLAYKGIVAGALLAFSRALGEFGATILLAGNIPGQTQTLSLAIYNLRSDRQRLGRLCAARHHRGLAFLFVWSLGVAAALGKEGVTCCCAAAYRWRALNSTSTSPSTPASRRSSDLRAQARRRCSTPSPACATIAAGEIEIDGKILFLRSERNQSAGTATRHRLRASGGALFPHLSVRTKYSLRRRARQSNTAITREFNGSRARSSGDRRSAATSGDQTFRRRSAARRARPRDLIAAATLLLDEPLAALDIGLKERILPYLARVRDEFAIPMIYVTHNVTEVLNSGGLGLDDSATAAWSLKACPRETLTLAARSAEIPDEQLENVFSATFIESDQSRANHECGCIRRGTFHSLPAAVRRTRRFRFASAPTIFSSPPNARRHIGGKYFAGTVRAIDMHRRSSDGHRRRRRRFLRAAHGAAVARLALEGGLRFFSSSRPARSECCRNRFRRFLDSSRRPRQIGPRRFNLVSDQPIYTYREA